MWFFFRRSRERQQARNQAQPISAKPRPLSFQQIIQDFGDFGDFRTHDAALKFWLPEPTERALTEFCGSADQSLSEWLRQFFVVYAYDLLAFTAIQGEDLDSGPDEGRPATAGPITLKSPCPSLSGKSLSPACSGTAPRRPAHFRTAPNRPPPMPGATTRTCRGRRSVLKSTAATGKARCAGIKRMLWMTKTRLSH